MRYRLLLGSMLALALAAPTAAPALADSGPEGAIIIPLVSGDGTPTEAAVAGFDALATEGAVADGVSSVHGTKRAFRASVTTTDTPAVPEESPSPSAPQDSAVPAVESGDVQTPGSLGTTPMPTNDPTPTVSPEPVQEGQSGGSDLEAIASELEAQYALFTDPIAIANDFAVAGVTWDSGDLPEGASVEMRTLDGDMWSDWYFLAVEKSDVQSARSGTEYYVSGASSAIQVRITQGEGELPAGLRIDISYSAEGPEVEKDGSEVAEVLPTADSLTDAVINPDELIASAAASYSVPQASDTGEKSAVLASAVVSGSQAASILGIAPAAVSGNAGIKPRSAWGAPESQTSWVIGNNTWFRDFQGVIIHHTAGSNVYSQAEVPSVIRGVFGYQAKTLGWGDIGYNVLIDKYGGRWEGRKYTLSSPAKQMVQGAHALPRNSGTMGISVLGNFVDVNPNSQILTAIEEVAAWKFIKAGIDPTSTSPLKVPVAGEPSYSGRPVLTPGAPLPRVAAHKEVAATACPGRIYNYMGEIRARVASLYRSGASVPTSSRMYLNDEWSVKANIEFSWGLPTDDVYVGDWDGDGKDTVAIRRGNQFAFTNDTTPKGNPVFTMGYGDPGDTIIVGDWDGDGKDTIAIRRGKQYFIKNTLVTGVADQTVIYGLIDDEVYVGDWDGNRSDTFAVRRGSIYYVRNSMTSGVADQVVPYGKPEDETYIGRFSASAKGDSIAVRRGATYYVTDTIREGVADRELVYGRAGDMTYVGDWNGDQVDTLGVRRLEY